MSPSRKRYLLLSVILIAAACVATGALLPTAQRIDRIQAQSSPQEEDTADQRLFVPIIQGAPGQTAGKVERQTEREGWETHTSASGGYGLSYPVDWTINDSGNKGILQIVSPSGKLEEKIWVEYLDYEKPRDQDLLSWAQAYYSRPHAPRDPALNSKTYIPVTLDVQPSSGQSQQLRMRDRLEPTGRTYLVTNRRLVLLLFTMQETPAQIDRLRTIAGSLRFSPDAPANLAELYAPAPKPRWTTLEEYETYIEEELAISRALSIRSSTGETATEILEGLSEAAQQRYTRQLEKHADDIAEMDRQRERNAELQQGEPITSTSEYEETEERWEELQQKENLHPP